MNCLRDYRIVRDARHSNSWPYGVHGLGLRDRRTERPDFLPEGRFTRASHDAGRHRQRPA